MPADSLVVSTRGRNPQEERKFTASYKDYSTSNSGKDYIATLPAVVKSHLSYHGTTQLEV